MRIALVLTGLCSLIFFSQVSCGPFEPRGGNVAIVVGERQITTEELKKDFEYISAGVTLPEGNHDEIKNQLLEQVVDYYLILEYGREVRFSLSEEELDSAIEEIKKDYPDNAFEEALLRGYVDFEQWKLRFREQLLVNRIIEKVTQDIPQPSYEEIKAYYDANQNEFRCPRMVQFRQIVCRTRQEAEDLMQRLKGGEDFRDLAREHSVAPEASNGGDVGWIAEDQLDESMEKVLFSLPEGKISPITKTPYGYHIFLVISTRTEGIKSLPDVMREIEAKLLHERREAFCKDWLGQLRNRFRVEVNRNVIEKMEIS